jgi:hypothetical protein
MDRVSIFVANVFDQLDPFNTGNQVLFYAWLGIFTFTTVAVWRCPFGWLRFICFIVNQLFSIGILISWSLTVLLAVTYWRESLVVLGTTAVVSFLLFRRRRPRRVAKPEIEPTLDGRGAPRLPPSRPDAGGNPL